jgi:hypothetical protein
MRWQDIDPGLAEGLRLLAYLSNRIGGSERERGFDPFDYTQPGTRHPIRTSAPDRS